MKKLVIVSILIMAIISLNCSSSKIAAEDQWKEKYGLENGKGVLSGKFAVRKYLKDWEFHFSLIKKENFFNMNRSQRIKASLQNPFQDSVSIQDSSLLINNIPPGEYFLYTSINKLKESGEPVEFGSAAFESWWCNYIIVFIKADTISKFPNLEVIPGKEGVAQMDIISGTEIKAADSCSVQLEYELLNESNYLNNYKKEYKKGT